MHTATVQSLTNTALQLEPARIGLPFHVDMLIVQDLEQLGRGDSNGEQIVEDRLASFIESVKK